MAFLQITAHASNTQMPHNQIINFLQRARCAKIEATARANVPQRCLEQGFVRAVICRNCATNNQQHYLPPNTCTPGHAIASSGGDTEAA